MKIKELKYKFQEIYNYIEEFKLKKYEVEDTLVILKTQINDLLLRVEALENK